MLVGTVLDDKYESALALDLAMALLRTFSESQQMAAQQFVNLYLCEDLQDQIPDVILHTIFSLVVTTDKPFTDITPLYLAVFLNTVCNTARDVDKLKKLKLKAEDKFTKLVFQNSQHFTKIQILRIVDFLGAYISQSAGRDLSQAEPFLIKLTQGVLSPQQK